MGHFSAHEKCPGCAIASRSAIIYCFITLTMLSYSRELNIRAWTVLYSGVAVPARWLPCNLLRGVSCVISRGLLYGIPRVGSFPCGISPAWPSFRSLAQYIHIYVCIATYSSMATLPFDPSMLAFPIIETHRSHWRVCDNCPPPPLFLDERDVCEALYNLI